MADRVRLARDAVDELCRQHDSLPDELRAASELLAEIVSAAAAAERATATVVTRVTGTDTGLLRLADGWLDDPQRGLRPWLERLDRRQATGDWLRASRGLTAWRGVATSALATARRAAEVNAAPLNRRGELRGLLRALHAKAVRHGVAEAPDLDVVFQRARETLYTSPVDLDAATELVMSYAAKLVGHTDLEEPTR